MADKTAVIQSTDLFALAAAAVEQNSTTSDTLQVAMILDNVGDKVVEAAFDNGTGYRNSFKYNGSDIVSDLATALTKFGGAADSKLVTEISVSFSVDDYPTIEYTAHNHDSNAHATGMSYADVSSVIPGSTGGVGVPDIWSNSNTDSCPTSVSVRFSMNHVDELGNAGEHWVGQNITFRADVDAEYINTPVLTLTNWQTDGDDTDDSNQAFDSYKIRAHRYFDIGGTTT